MSGFKVNIDGLQVALNKLDVKRYEPQIQKSFEKFGVNVEREAKKLAPVDEGHLRSAIYQQAGILQVTIGCSVDYAAYLEFGTRSFASEYVAALPATWKELASQYRGAGGGSFEEMVIRITEWVKRKGFAALQTKSGNRSKSIASDTAQNEAAYLIARSICIKGIRPHPFLFPAVEMWTPALIKDLQASMKKTA